MNQTRELPIILKKKKKISPKWSHTDTPTTKPKKTQPKEKKTTLDGRIGTSI
jgi:hypothetical protein